MKVSLVCRAQQHKGSCDRHVKFAEDHTFFAPDEGDMGALCANLSGAADEGKAGETLTPWLLDRAKGDGWDAGRRHTLMAWSVRLCRWAQWRQCGTLLAPALHLGLTAPKDESRNDWLRAALDHNPVRQDHLSGTSPLLKPEQSERS